MWSATKILYLLNPGKLKVMPDTRGPIRRGKSGGLTYKQGGMWKIERTKITTEYEKQLHLLCFVDEFPITKRRKYPQYTS